MPMEGGTRVVSRSEGLFLLCDDCETASPVGQEAHHEERLECDECGMKWEVNFLRDFGSQEYRIFAFVDNVEIFLSDVIAESPAKAVEHLEEHAEDLLDERGQWALDEADKFTVMRPGPTEVVS